GTLSARTGAWYLSRAGRRRGDAGHLGVHPAAVRVLASARRGPLSHLVLVTPRREAPMRLPSSVQLEPVGQCNLRCEMCPIQFRQEGPPYGPPAVMDFDLFTRLVDQFDGL